MVIFYAYELIDPRDNLPFYVGKGSYDRMYKHKQQAFQEKGSKINPHKSSKIRQIINEGHDILYKKYQCNTEAKAFAKERQLIKQHKHQGINLTNLTDGGEGYSGGHIPVNQYDLFGEFITQHQSAKTAAFYLGKKHYGQITAVCRGGYNGEVSAFGYLWSYVDKNPKLRDKIRPVYQWTTAGSLIRKYTSVAEASRALKCDPSNIPRAIKKNWKSRGFVWSYEDIFPSTASVQC